MGAFLRWVDKNGKEKQYRLDVDIASEGFFVGRLTDEDVRYVSSARIDEAAKKIGVWIFNPRRNLYYYGGVDDPSVSRRHLKIVLSEASRILVSDHGRDGHGASKTLLNGSEVPKGATLQVTDGSRVRLGLFTTEFTFVGQPGSAEAVVAVEATRHEPIVRPVTIEQGVGAGAVDELLKGQEAMRSLLSRVLKILKWQELPPIISIEEKIGRVHKEYFISFACQKCDNVFDRCVRIQGERKWFSLLCEGLKLLSGIGGSATLSRFTKMPSLGGQVGSIVETLRARNVTLSSGKLEELENLDLSTFNMIKDSFFSSELYQTVEYDPDYGWIHRTCPCVSSETQR